MTRRNIKELMRNSMFHEPVLTVGVYMAGSYVLEDYSKNAVAWTDNQSVSQQLNGERKEPNMSAWKPITEAFARKVLVTNNLGARDANGQMSHVWVVNMVHWDGDGFEAFGDDSLRLLYSLTHYAEIPDA